LASTEFPHLPLPVRVRGAARLSGGGEANEKTTQNKADPGGHGGRLKRRAEDEAEAFRRRQAERAAAGLPVAAGMPMLVQIDPALDLSELQSQLGFEIVAEQEDGFVIVAAHDLDLAALQAAIAKFVAAETGGGVVAKVYDIAEESSDERLKRILGDLYVEWPAFADDQTYLMDVSISCNGTVAFPNEPTIKGRGERETEARWAARQATYQKKVAEWSERKHQVYVAWDQLKEEREGYVSGLVRSYGGEILSVDDAMTTDRVADSFTMRMELTGKALRDLVQTYPYVWEVARPDEHGAPDAAEGIASDGDFKLLAPAETAPAVGIIDSGLQEGHRLLSAAIDGGTSISFVPGDASVADSVVPGGHGTRVAGAVLFGEQVPTSGEARAICWLQNARVLDADNRLPERLPAAIALGAAVLRLHSGPRNTRIFNHSVTGRDPCRKTHMSAWAAEIDALSAEYDVLVIQAAGNLPSRSAAPRLGIEQHLGAGRDYPDYLHEPSCRVANPAQSLQALTVGSVAYDVFEEVGKRSFGEAVHAPSSFSRAGPGIWNVIKPEVVELGGDWARSGERALPGPANAFPELVRATQGGGPAVARDAVGTSFAAPKVTHIAARLQALLPEASTLLYRALIVQSARWPQWAEARLKAHAIERKRCDSQKAKLKRAQKKAEKRGTTPSDEVVDETQLAHLAREVTRVLGHIGYGLPSLERATRNSDYRTTLVTMGHDTITVGECCLFEVTVPAAIRQHGEALVLVEVTLSYAATPKRTRRRPQGYQSVWLDWKTNERGESLASFRARALEEEGDREKGKAIPWTLGAKDIHGQVKGVRRSSGSVQKDWAVVKLAKFGASFCIAVVAHKGHSNDSEARANFALAVSFEVVGQEVAIYDHIRAEETIEEDAIEIEV